MVTKEEALLALCKSNLSPETVAEMVVLFGIPQVMVENLRQELRRKAGTDRDSTSLERLRNWLRNQPIRKPEPVMKAEAKAQSQPIQSFQSFEGVLNLVALMRSDTPAQLIFPTEGFALAISRRDLDSSHLLQEILMKNPLVAI